MTLAVEPGAAIATSRSANHGVLSCAVALLAVGTWVLATQVSARQSVLFLVGATAGIALYHAAFGFTSAWRDLIVRRRGAGLRAQMVMLAITTSVFVPAIAHGSVLGQTVRGSVAPAGLPVIAGAFLFGIGMQLGGGCASGTLFTVGGGSVRMIATLVAFIAGSVLGVRYAGVWEQAPALRPMSLVGEAGPIPALLLSLAAYIFITGVSLVIERPSGDTGRSGFSARQVVAGPWPLLAGAVALAAVNVATLVVAGRPWASPPHSHCGDRRR